MENEFSEAFGRVLADHCTTDVVRRIEISGEGDALWRIVEETGFLDALVPENMGGAGLGHADIAPLIALAGRYVLPSPFAETMFARAIFAHHNVEIPKGRVAIVLSTQDDQLLRAPCVTFGRVAEYVLVEDGGELLLLDVSKSEMERNGTRYDLCADFLWRQISPVAKIPAGDVALCVYGALISAALIAGALRNVIDMTLKFVGERKQFGRNIGKFQALQQQISVMSEHVAATTIAAQLALSSDVVVDAKHAAVAKITAAEAVKTVVPIAHGVFAAIGISEEHDLQLFTRRLHLWRMEFGGESHWAEALGRARVSDPVDSTVDFIREHLSGA